MVTGSRRGLAAATALSTAVGTGLPPVARAADERPSLVVMLVVDQMRADYLTHYGPRWNAGLRRLIDHGAVFVEATYPYARTVTCAGHATVATGTLPFRHGMARNSWWDPAREEVVWCTRDDDYPVVPYTGAAVGGESPRPIRVPTLADVLRVETGGRVATASLKPRSAITLAGHAGDAVTWIGANSAGDGVTWLTSRAYTEAPVPAVRRFVDGGDVAADHGWLWARSRPGEDYLFDDDAEGERAVRGWGATFPHVAVGTNGAPDETFMWQWRATPRSDAALGRMARILIDELALGRGSGVDFLGISFSALDYSGHAFGPRSHEVQDVLFRLDVTIGELLEHLDRRLGRDRYVVALSSDHGVGQVPEQSDDHGFGGRVESSGVSAAIEFALAQRWGPGRYVASIVSEDIYLAPGVSERLAADREAWRTVERAIVSRPGIRHLYRADELASGPTGGDDDAELERRSYFRGRSGDLVMVWEPYWISSNSAATHGTAYLYDRRVPLIFYGAGVAPGVHRVAAGPHDVVPTLAELVGVTLPITDGRVLHAALATSTAH